MLVFTEPSSTIFVYSLTVPLGSKGLQNEIAAAMRWNFIFWCPLYHATVLLYIEYVDFVTEESE